MNLIRHVRGDKAFKNVAYYGTNILLLISDYKSALIAVSVSLSVVILILIGVIIYTCLKLKR